MNDLGQIKEFKTEDEAKAAGYGIKLTPEEAQDLTAFPEDQRVMELGFREFWNTQKKFRLPKDKQSMHHAFVTGFKFALLKVNDD